MNSMRTIQKMPRTCTQNIQIIISNHWEHIKLPRVRLAKPSKIKIDAKVMLANNIDIKEHLVNNQPRIIRDTESAQGIIACKVYEG